jgi:hypothetical protein
MYLLKIRSIKPEEKIWIFCILKTTEEKRIRIRDSAFWACFRENWVYNFGHGSADQDPYQNITNPKHWSDNRRNIVTSECYVEVSIFQNTQDEIILAQSS